MFKTPSENIFSRAGTFLNPEMSEEPENWLRPAVFPATDHKLSGESIFWYLFTAPGLYK